MERKTKLAEEYVDYKWNNSGKEGELVDDREHTAKILAAIRAERISIFIDGYQKGFLDGYEKRDIEVQEEK